MKILIKVTKDILKRSAGCRAMDGANCAIALAVRELFPKARIGVNVMTFTGDTNDTYELPENAKLFIRAFENLAFRPSLRLYLEAFSFEMTVPSHVVDQIGISEAYKVLSESKTLELVHP